MLTFAYVYNWSVVPRAGGIFMAGLIYTMRLSFLSLACALVVGLLIAVCNMSSMRLLKGFGYLYVQFFRALSLYIYMLWVYFGFPAVLGIQISQFAAGLLSLTLLNSAYMAETYRSALNAVDVGQHEAATSLGMSRLAVFVSVILPQAFRIAVPSLVNQFMDIVKDSSYVAVIGAQDLMYRTNLLAGYYQRPFEFYTAAGALYVAVVLLTAWAAARLEKHFRRHLVA